MFNELINNLYKKHTDWEENDICKWSCTTKIVTSHQGSGCSPFNVSTAALCSQENYNSPRVREQHLQIRPRSHLDTDTAAETVEMYRYRFAHAKTIRNHLRRNRFRVLQANISAVLTRTPFLCYCEPLEENDFTVGELDGGYIYTGSGSPETGRVCLQRI